MAETLAGATLVLMIMNMTARLLGFFRETAVAAIYGASDFTDAYQVAYTLPYFLQMVLGMALVSSIVPVIVHHLGEGKKERAWEAASITINLTVALMAVFAVLGVIFSEILVRLTAPELPAATSALAARMTSIMFPSVIFMSAAMLVTGILNACKRFALAAFAPAFSSLVIIVGVLAFGGRHPMALPGATLISFCGMLLIQLPGLKGTGFRYRLAFDLKNPDVRSIFGNLGAVFVGTATYQIYLAINRFFASGLAAGSISALNYAGKLMNLPLGVFVSSVASAIFPILSAQALAKDRRPMWESVDRGLKLVFLITLPAALGLMALGQPIVQLLFQRGAFKAQDTVMTAQALFWFGPGMAGMAATQILTRAYYALGNSKTPLATGLASIAVNILASRFLIEPLGPGGLSLANSLASIFNAAAMYGILHRRLPGHAGKGLLLTSLKALAASLATAAAALAVYRPLSRILDLSLSSGGFKLAAGVAAAIAAGVLAYIIVIFLLKENELLTFARQLKGAKKGAS